MFQSFFFKNSFWNLKKNSNLYILDNFWGDLKNQVDFFHQLAAKRKINPLVPTDWYSLDVETILESKVTFYSF